MENPQFTQSKRNEVWAAYERGETSYEVNTKPYHSTQVLRATVVEVDATNQFAFAVFRPQTLDFFNYGVGDQIPFGAVTRRANDADTNLGKANSTNGAADVVIEGLGFSSRGYRVVDANVSAAPQEPFLSAAPPTDPDVVAMRAGQCPVVDPASVYTPPQVYSPFNLEDAMFNGVLGYMSCEIEWDRRRQEKLGAIDIMPQGGARSLLRSNGVPNSRNRWTLDEGYIWRRDGQPDSELIVRVQLHECVVVPLVLNDDPATPADTVVPSFIDVDVQCRLFGLEFELPSGN